MPSILGANEIKATGYDVANSVRFNSADSPTLKDSAGDAAPAGNRKKFTWSIWFKRSKLGVTQMLGSAAYSSNDEGYIYISGGDILVWHHNSSGMGQMITTQKFMDVSAWYHLVWAVDTTQGTASNRMKFYINGTQITSFSTETYPDQNKEIYWNVGGTYYPYIGRRHGGDYWDGYLAEVVQIDDAQLAADSFGEFDSNSEIWKPIDVSDLTFGTSGYYLDFKDSSDLGKDVSGVGNHFASTNLAATDQSTDTCTNNFATLNPLMNNLNNLPTLSEGNLEVLAVSGSTWSVTPSTIGLPKSGKWYYEVEAVSGTSGDRAAFAGWMNPAVSNPLGNGSILWRNISANNSILSNDSAASGTFSATTWGTNGHIIGLYIDMDNSKLYFAHNGTIQNSGTGIDFQGTFDDDTFILPVVMVINTDKLSVNFGNPATNFVIASGNTDANGFGNFEYDPSAGSFDGASKDFLAICTKNLAEVT